MKFDRDFAPEGWNYAQDDDPDVVFMGWGGYPEGGTAAAVQRGAQGRRGVNWIENEKASRREEDWDRAKALSRDLSQ